MEGEIERIDYVPDPVTFYEEYVLQYRPFVMQGAVKDTTPLTTWTDEYLKSTFGDAEVAIEMNKKEKRGGPGDMLPLAEFIDRYKDEAMYVVDEVPKGMRDQVKLPGCLSCGGFLDNANTVFMWFSSGGTKSVLHTDSFHNMHCVVSGEKRFIMLPPEYTKVIGPEGEGQGYYNLDVEAVNMTAYPKMVDVPWYKAVLSPGDCMYIPYHWIHHVHSINRNIGVNLWWAPYQPSMKECKGRTDFKDLISLVDVVPKPFLAMKLIFLTAVSEDKKIYAEEVLSKLHKHPMMGEFFTREAVDEIFDIIRPNSGGVLEESEILNMPHDKAQTLMGTFERIEMEMMEKMYGDFEGGGFPPEDGEWSDEGPPPPHQHFEL
jgi:lysine-specific demethylase 8